MEDKFSWSLEIDGSTVGIETQNFITRASFNQNRDIMSQLELDLTCPLVDENSRTKDIFSRGRNIAIFGGWGRQTFLGAGIIDTFRLDIQGQRMTVIARDKGKAFSRKQEKETFEKTKDSDIVKKIAGKYGVATQLDETKAQVSRVQSHLTDFEFIRDLAARNGYEFFFEYDVNKRQWTLHFHAPVPNKQGQAFIYDYSAKPTSPVISFDPEVSGEVERKAQLKLVAFLNDERGPTTIEGKVAGDASVREVIGNIWFQNQKEAQAYFDALVKQRNETYMTARASVLGNEKLKVGEIHSFQGLTPKFFRSLDGDYRINELTHTILSGESVVFRTDLELYRVG